jgi:stage II sporulation protein D
MLKSFLRYVHRHQSVQLIAAGAIVFLMGTLVLSSCGRQPAVHNRGRGEENQLKIRVAIVSHGRNIKIQSTEPFRIYRMDSDTPAMQDTIYKITTLSVMNATPEGMQVGSLNIPLPECRIVPREGAAITVYEVEQNKKFYGNLFLYRNERDGTIDVVNEVGLEDYLAGVLGREVSSAWPVEALKAQAVASRTRVLHQRQEARANKQRFDVQSDTRDQVYGGVPEGKDAERLFQAVRSTAGQVLTYNGKIFNIYFASTCGGMTENAARVFKDNDHPPGGVECPYCGPSAANSPVFEWTHRVPKAEVEQRIQAHTTDTIGDIVSITGLNCDKAGHAEAVEVTYKNADGTNSVTIFPDANKFRTTVLERGVIQFLGKDEQWHPSTEDPKQGEFIMSASFTAEIQGNDIIFRGHGWGHAVGMCQFGALGMAQQGTGYGKILSFYYPGSQIAENYSMSVLNGSKP